MESREDPVRVKEEPNDTGPHTGDNYTFHTVDSSDVKTSEKLTVIQSSKDMASQEKLDENIIIDFECQYVKTEMTSLSATIRKNEHKIDSSIVKVENENQIEDTHEKIFIDFECRDFKPKLEPLSTTSCKTELQSRQPNVEVENENKTNNINEDIFIDFECQDVKLEPVAKVENEKQENYLNEKRLIVLIQKDFDYHIPISY
ncbi:hypothetical protein TKK_0005259 [Trichogramma kaykai]